MHPERSISAYSWFTDNTPLQYKQQLEIAVDTQGRASNSASFSG